MRIYRYGAVLLLAVALAGCAAATKMAEPTPEPPSLLGTWQLTDTDPADEANTRLFTLTFRPARWVLAITVRDDAGEIVDEYAQVGAWAQNETTIVKTWHPWDDDTDLPSVDAMMLAKRYSLTADTLTVQNWDDNAPDAEDTTMRRVTDPAILTTLAGSEWVRESTNDEGTLERWTLTVTDAGFEYTFNDPNLSGAVSAAHRHCGAA